MENATQFVHGTPKLAASHRTCQNVNSDSAFAHTVADCSSDVACLSGDPEKRVAAVNPVRQEGIRTFLAWQVYSSIRWHDQHMSLHYSVPRYRGTSHQTKQAIQKGSAIPHTLLMRVA